MASLATQMIAQQKPGAERIAEYRLYTEASILAFELSDWLAATEFAWKVAILDQLHGISDLLRSDLKDQAMRKHRSIQIWKED